jgi:CPA1 family monovalent cation:H+ antiporter
MLVIIFLLGVAAVFLVFAGKVKFPFTVALVIAGGVLGLLAQKIEMFGFLHGVALTEDLIFYLFLPVLIFDAAIHIHVTVLKKNIIPVLILAVLGVMVSAILTGGGVSWLLDISFAGALVFGSLISATDPVAVVALFDEVGAPRRLKTLVDGESLFNDATAIVLFNVVIAFAAGNESFSPGDAAVSFAFTLLGGIAVGVAVAVVALGLVALDIGNIVYLITVSIVSAYLSFIAADHFFHVSGVMAAMSTGILLRYVLEKRVNFARLKSISNLWNYLSFAANSMIFLLLGLTEAKVFSDAGDLEGTVIDIAIAAAVITVARAVVVYGLIPLYNRISKEYRINEKTKFVMFWGGLRGAVPVALVLMIPQNFEHRILIIHLTMGYILFTLLVQGTTMSMIMKKLRIKKDAVPFDDKPYVRTSFEFYSSRVAALVFSELLDLYRTEGAYVFEKDNDRYRRDAEIHVHDVIIELSLKGKSIFLMVETEHLESVKDKLDKTVEAIRLGAKDNVRFDFKEQPDLNSVDYSKA